MNGNTFGTIRNLNLKISTDRFSSIAKPIQMIESNFIFGDCMDKRFGLQTYPDNYFDFAICDPQYAIGASKPSRKPCKVLQKNGSYLKSPSNDYEHKEWDNELMPHSYFLELHRVAKKVMIWGANYQNFPLRGGRLIWDKLNGGSDQYDAEIAYLSWTLRVETVYYMWSGMFQGLKPSRDIRIAYKQRGNKKTNEKRIHPTQKPAILYDWILKEYAQEGDLILDTHVGSASSLIACENLGFNYIGFEKDKQYYNDARERLDAEKLPLFS